MKGLIKLIIITTIAITTNSCIKQNKTNHNNIYQSSQLIILSLNLNKIEAKNISSKIIIHKNEIEIIPNKPTTSIDIQTPIIKIKKYQNLILVQYPQKILYYIIEPIQHTNN